MEQAQHTGSAKTWGWLGGKDGGGGIRRGVVGMGGES